MWFKNLCIYNLPNLSMPLEVFESLLLHHRLQSCGASEARSVGWASPRGNDLFIHNVGQQWLIALGVEERLLPTSIIRQFAADRAKAIAEAEGRQVGRREMRDIREALAIELLPRAFPRRRTTFAWIDPVNGWLMIDTSSQPKGEELLEHLRKSVDGFQARLIKTKQSPSSAMTGWIASGEAPSGFTIDQDIEMRSAENGVVRYVKLSLEGDDVREHIATGKVVTKLALTWNDRISFVLTENLQIKRLGFLDILKEQAETQAENEEERFDIDFTLMTGEVGAMFKALISALGGAD